MLAPFVLALDFHFLGRAAFVPDADGALGLVDVLAPRAAGAHSLPLDVLVLDFYLHLIRFRQHRNRGGRRVDAALLLSLGDALHAMPAAFETEPLIDVVAGDAAHDFFVAPLFAAVERDVLDLPAALAGEHRIHAVQIAGEDGRLVTAGAGADFEDDAVVVLVAGQQNVFEPA